MTAVTIIPFGPFNGRPVAELPDWYLYQLSDRILPARLAVAVEDELVARSRERRDRRRAA
jgi:hypothetical protein